jgi:hypothetical protein
VQFSLTEPLNPLSGDRVSTSGLLPGGAEVMVALDRKYGHRGNGERHRNLLRWQIFRIARVMAAIVQVPGAIGEVVVTP